jgi:hypothetical protein
MGPKELTEVSSAGAVLVSVKVGKLLRSHARALHLPEQTFYILPQNKTIIMLKTVCGYVGLVWFSLVWFGEILFSLLDFLDFASCLCFVRLGLVWSGLVWSGLVWSGLVWSGLVWSGLVWSGLVWSGLVWFGLACSGLFWSVMA